MKRVVFFLTATAVLVACSVTDAETTFNNTADAGISPRARGELYANNFGGYPPDLLTYGYDVGGSDAADDYTYVLIRWDLSAYAGPQALGDGTITIAQGTLRTPPRNFLNLTVDLYAMPLSNADWEEGTGYNQLVAGSAWNRKKGDYSLTPPDADKWLPTGTNDPRAGISLIDSYTYLGVDEDIVYTVPQATINQWLDDGVASVLLRSDTWTWSTTVRYWNMNSREAADAEIGGYHVLSFEPVPEPGMLMLILAGMSAGACFLIRRR